MNFEPEIQKIYDSLEPKQKAFIDAYLTNGYRGTQAALTAKYSEKSVKQIATENLSKPSIRAVLDSVISSAAIRAGITHDFLFQEQLEILQACKEGKSTDSGRLDAGNANIALAHLAKLAQLAPEVVKSTNEHFHYASDNEKLMEERIAKHLKGE